MNKNELLKQVVQHIDITQFCTGPLIESMGNMSFTARELSKASDIFNRMLQDPDCTIFLSIAGSTSAAGCMQLYADMVKYRMVDAIVATGATIIDMDFFEALGFKHYQANVDVEDQMLHQLGIDRIYDTYIDESELQQCDSTIQIIADSLPVKSYSSREFIHELGRYLMTHQKKEGSLIAEAYKHEVPIFCPAFTDSSAGFGLVMHQINNPDAHITLDSIRDFRELTDLKIASKKSGIFIIGGGVPKNFLQDTVVCANLQGHDVAMHEYAIQITVADVRDGACSSSTLKEALSWGKVAETASQMVFSEATLALPLIVSDAYHRGHWKNRQARSLQSLFSSSVLTAV